MMIYKMYCVADSVALNGSWLQNGSESCVGKQKRTQRPGPEVAPIAEEHQGRPNDTGRIQRAAREVATRLNGDVDSEPSC